MPPHRTQGGRGEAPHQLIDLAFDAMFARSFHERVITFWNDGAERLYGWTRGEAVGKIAPELLGSEYPIPLEQIEDELKRTGRWQGEIRQRRKDGSPVNVACRWGLQTDAAGAPLAILEINSDLTREQASAERLRWSEERFTLLVSAVTEYAIFMLDRDGVVATWNEGAERIKGYRTDEIVGRHFSTFYTAEDRAAHKPERLLGIAEVEGSAKDEGWRVRKDGSRFWASVVITALRDEAGKLRGFAKVTRDITDRHNEEERLREYAQQMAELEQSKAQFLDLAAHEIRGPLTLIRGYNSLLEEGKLPQERIPSVARLVEGKLEQIDLLVQQMLEMGRLENNRLELDFEVLDLFEITRRQIERMKPVAGDIPITLRGEKGKAIVNGDRSRIATMISNLLANAIKYSPDGGKIECTVADDGSEATVSVRDHGLGIADEHIPLLFKRYSRLPTEANKFIHGTGLALYLCQEIARRHGGEITVESELGKGSEFTIRLPAVDAHNGNHGAAAKGIARS